jgi:hypothetical protein
MVTNEKHESVQSASRVVLKANFMNEEVLVQTVGKVNDKIDPTEEAHSRFLVLLHCSVQELALV